MSPTDNFYFNVDNPAVLESISEVRSAFGPDRKKLFVLGAGISSSAGSMYLMAPTQQTKNNIP